MARRQVGSWRPTEVKRATYLRPEGVASLALGGLPQPVVLTDMNYLTRVNEG